MNEIPYIVVSGASVPYPGWGCCYADGRFIPGDANGLERFHAECKRQADEWRARNREAKGHA